MEAVNSLTKLLQTCLSSSSGDGGDNVEIFCTSARSNCSKDGSELEVVFRRQLDSLGSDMVQTLQLLKFSLKFARREVETAAAIGKIPYLLIEDILESLTISSAEDFWSHIESLTEDLLVPELFAKGKLTVLKFCNALLRRLSKSCNTEFCGRILMFLAAVYPISERSGLNLGGKVNVGVTTEFETEEVFLANQQSSARSPVEIDGNEGEQKDGSVRMATEEDGEEVREKNSYESYKLFWELQGYFSEDLKKLETDFGLVEPTASAKSVPPPTVSALNAPSSNNANWMSFLKHADSLMDTLEAHPYSASEIEQGREMMYRELQRSAELQRKMRNDDASSGSVMDVSEASGDSSTDYLGCKYLTSSRLFSLQLRDPSVRVQILAQVLIFAQQVVYRLASLAQSAESAARTVPVNVISIGSNKNSIRGDKDPRGVAPSSSTTATAAAASSASSLTAAQIQTLQAQLTSLCSYYRDIQRIQERAFKNILSTPSNGPSLISSLKALLRRELLWMEWKAQNCKTFEKPAWTPEEFAKLKLPVKTETKRKKEPSNKGLEKKLAASYISDISTEGVTKISKRLVNEVPTLDQHIQRFLDAEDPDNGIEEDYHPRHDSVYCWRARRLIAEKNLSCFSKMHNGDLTRAVRELFHLPEYVPRERPAEPTFDDFFKIDPEELEDVPDDGVSQDTGDTNEDVEVVVVEYIQETASKQEEEQLEEKVIEKTDGIVDDAEAKDSTAKAVRSDNREAAKKDDKPASKKQKTSK